ncbi:MAG: hypothetical protein ACRDT8_18105 [Micromonosporaceae bacterium]
MTTLPCRRVAGTLLLAVTVAAVAALAGCGGLAHREGAAERVARRLHTALADGHGGDACRVLAPQTRHELMISAKHPCARTVLAKKLPVAGRARSVEAYGSQAWVVFSHDTVFLAEFSGVWKVTAAGCRARGADRPYDCVIKGG